MANPESSGKFEIWITNRIPFSVLAPESGDTGTFEVWITSKFPFLEYQETIYIEPKYITNAGNIASVESWGSGIMKGVERPDSDTSLGNWTDHNEGTSNIYQAIDEVYPGDSDYIRTPVSGTPSIYQGGLSSIGDPGVHTYHVLKYRYRKNQLGMSKTVSITVRLMQGETEIASWNHPNAGETWTTVEQTLTEGQAGNITDYTNLSLKIEAVEV